MYLYVPVKYTYIHFGIRIAFSVSLCIIGVYCIWIDFPYKNLPYGNFMKSDISTSVYSEALRFSVHHTLRAFDFDNRDIVLPMTIVLKECKLQTYVGTDTHSHTHAHTHTLFYIIYFFYNLFHGIIMNI